MYRCREGNLPLSVSLTPYFLFWTPHIPLIILFHRTISVCHHFYCQTYHLYPGRATTRELSFFFLTPTLTSPLSGLCISWLPSFHNSQSVIVIPSWSAWRPLSVLMWLNGFLNSRIITTRKKPFKTSPYFITPPGNFLFQPDTKGSIEGSILTPGEIDPLPTPHKPSPPTKLYFAPFSLFLWLNAQ